MCLDFVFYNFIEFIISSNTFLIESLGFAIAIVLLLSFCFKCIFFLPSFFLSLSFFSVFLWLHLWYMKVPRLRIKSKQQLQDYTITIAMWEPSCICDLHHSSQHCWILNPLSKARKWTQSSWILVRFITIELQQELLLFFLIALARISSTMLNKSGKSETFVLFLILEKKLSAFYC